MGGAEEKLEAIRRDIEFHKRQLSDLEAQASVLKELIEDAKSARKRGPRLKVKEHVFRLLEEVGSDGLNAAIAVKLAAEQGIRLERGSVSSFLSRMKADQAVTYGGGVYRLAKYSGVHRF